MKLLKLICTLSNYNEIWIALCTYVLIAIVKKRLKLDQSLYEILQILSLSMFEKTPINQLFTGEQEISDTNSEQFQLPLH
jgi:hypothetical protein